MNNIDNQTRHPRAAGVAATKSPATAKPSNRACIVVLGMHRSGTSIVTRVFSLLGAGLPKNVLGEGSGNSAGHWEPKTIIELHDIMLSKLGSSWNDWRKLPAERVLPWRNRLAKTFTNEYGKQPLTVFKDPRVCRFAGTYFDIFARLSIEPVPVLVFRNPLAVCDSLEKRNGFSREHAALVWLRHMLDAEQSTRGLKRSVISYEKFVADWRKELAASTIETAFARVAGLARNECEIDAHISPDLSHHSYPRSAIAGAGIIGKWLRRTFDAFEELRQDPNDMAAQFSLDQVGEAFHPLAEAFGAAAFGEVARLELELDRLRAVERMFLAARTSSTIENERPNV